MKNRWRSVFNSCFLYGMIGILCFGMVCSTGMMAVFAEEEKQETVPYESVSAEQDSSDTEPLETEYLETEPLETESFETEPMETVSSRDLSQTVNQTIKEVRSFVLSEDKNPDKDSQWYVLSCARSGLSLDKKYFRTFFKNIVSYLKEKEGVITSNQYSEYSKMILVLTSLGYDARDVAGYDLLSYLSDFTKVKKQGFNGPVWALLAMNCHPLYEISENGEAEIQTTEEVLISYLLEKELEGGGWTFSGEKADTDMTAITIQAMAPYYNQIGYEDVTAAIDRGIELLSSMQNPETGGFQSGGIDNLESCAQVVVALSTLGIDCKSDSRFVKNENWPVYDLISYQMADSGFRHIKDGNISKLATAQGLYALDAYKRFTKGQTALYDMSDVVLTVGEIEEEPEETTGKPEKETQKETQKKPQKETKPHKEETKPNKKNETQKEPNRETHAVKETKPVTNPTQATTQARKDSSTSDPYRGGNKIETSGARVPSSLSLESKKQEVETEEAGSQSLEYAVAEEGAWSFEGEDYVSSDSFDAGLGAEEDESAEEATAVRKGTSDHKRELGLLGGMTCILFGYCFYDFMKKKQG